MKGLLIAGCLVVAACFPQAASAESHLSKRQAEANTRDAVSKYYEDTAAGEVVPSCRPQGLARARPGYDYRHWVCDFAIAGDEYEYCDDPENQYFGGRFKISGRDGVGSYTFRVLNGLRCL